LYLLFLQLNLPKFLLF